MSCRREAARLIEHGAAAAQAEALGALPVALLRCIRKLVRRDPAQRYQSAAEVYEDLQAAQGAR